MAPFVAAAALCAGAAGCGVAVTHENVETGLRAWASTRGGASVVCGAPVLGLSDVRVGVRDFHVAAAKPRPVGVGQATVEGLSSEGRRCMSDVTFGFMTDEIWRRRSHDLVGYSVRPISAVRAGARGPIGSPAAVRGRLGSPVATSCGGQVSIALPALVPLILDYRAARDVGDPASEVPAFVKVQLRAGDDAFDLVPESVRYSGDSAPSTPFIVPVAGDYVLQFDCLDFERYWPGKTGRSWEGQIRFALREGT
jgi:hypothetical protein